MSGMIKARLHWLLVWLAYHAWMRLPMHWRIAWRLLPHAGHYGYSRDFADFCTTPSVAAYFVPGQDQTPTA
jgi:hypothetical protein